MQTTQNLKDELRAQLPYLRERYAVDPELVWDTVQRRFPQLKPHLRRILSGLEPDG